MTYLIVFVAGVVAGFFGGWWLKAHKSDVTDAVNAEITKVKGKL